MKANLEARCVGDESRSVVEFGQGPVESDPPAKELASSVEVETVGLRWPGEARPHSVRRDLAELPGASAPE
jgi:hypothetical protein